MRRISPRKLLATSLLLAGLLMVWLAVSPYRSYLRHQQTESRNLRVTALVGKILFLDEVLTMSARLAAASEDRKWEERYYQHEPQLDAALKELLSLAGGAAERDFVESTQSANNALVGMEYECFALIRKGKAAQGLKIVLGETYQRQKAEYSGGLTELIAGLELAKAVQSREARVSVIRLAAGAMMLIVALIVAWGAILMVLKNVSQADAENAKLLELEHAVTDILAQSGNPQDLMSRVLAAIGGLQAWDLGTWWLIDRARGELHCVAQWHAPSRDFEAFERVTSHIRFKFGVGLPGRVWSTGQVHVIEDVEKDANFVRTKIAKAMGLRGALGFPIFLQSDSMGMIEFFSSSVTPPSDKFKETLKSLGAQIGHRIKRMDLDAQIIQVQKMEAIGRLAGGVAHEFNNNLFCILGLCDLIGNNLPNESPIAQDIAEIKSVAQGSAALAHQLLSFSRKKTELRKTHDANKLILASQKMLQGLLGSQFPIECKLAETPLPIAVDPGEFNQVLVNLAINARDALPSTGGRLRIEASQREGFAEITFIDGGCGMSPEIVAHLFEPFFTTKAEGKGTGLGLPAVQSIVAGSGGGIEVESQPGSGTQVLLRFPLSTGPLERKISGIFKGRESKGRTILLVEDEPNVLKVATRQLEFLGYSVLAAKSGQEAIALFQLHSEEISLVITDVNMPGTNGVELVRELRAMDAHAKILFISGYGLDVLDPYNRPRDSEFLAKPLSSEDLVKKISSMLAASSS